MSDTIRGTHTPDPDHWLRVLRRLIDKLDGRHKRTVTAAVGYFDTEARLRGADKSLCDDLEAAASNPMLGDDEKRACIRAKNIIAAEIGYS